MDDLMATLMEKNPMVDPGGGGGYGYGPCKGCWGKGYAMPYGGKGKGKFGDCKGKGKNWKGKGFAAKPKEEKPLINPNLVTPSKDAMDGGINFKTILQEHVSKVLKRPIAQGDLVYESLRSMHGKIGTLRINCLGQREDGTPFAYEASRPCKDDKTAHQHAAAKGLEDIFPEVHTAALEMHSVGILKALEVPTDVLENADLTNDALVDELLAKAFTGASSSTAVVASTEPDPKSVLNHRVQLTISRPIAKEDLDYQTAKSPSGGFVCNLRLIAIDGGEQVYDSGPIGHSDIKSAQKAAAKAALEQNAEMFDIAVEANQQQKKNAKGSSKGKSKKGGSYKGYR